jgi:hypothetical protein
MIEAELHTDAAYRADHLRYFRCLHFLVAVNRNRPRDPKLAEGGHRWLVLAMRLSAS